MERYHRSCSECRRRRIDSEDSTRSGLILDRLVYVAKPRSLDHPPSNQSVHPNNVGDLRAGGRCAMRDTFVA